MTDFDIVELTDESDLRWAYPVMKQLRLIDEAEFLELVDAMRDESGYQLFGGVEDNEVRAVAGVVVRTNLYHGRHAWVHDLVVDETYRGAGYGSQLLSWLESWAEKQNCTCLELASGLWRKRAHSFYEKAGMEKYCLTFKKELSADAPANSTS